MLSEGSIPIYVEIHHHKAKTCLLSQLHWQIQGSSSPAPSYWPELKGFWTSSGTLPGLKDRLFSCWSSTFKCSTSRKCLKTPGVGTRADFSMLNTKLNLSRTVPSAYKFDISIWDNCSGEAGHTGIKLSEDPQVLKNSRTGANTLVYTLGVVGRPNSNAIN